MLKVFVASTDIADISGEIALSGYWKRKIEATHHTGMKRERIAASTLLSYALKRCFGLDECELEYAEGDYGKPYVASLHGVHFNISHTDGYCAVAVSDAHVGVDIQRIEPELSEGKKAVIRRFFSESEWEFYGLSEDTPSLFYRLWTAKESAVKCTGEGLSAGIRRFTIPASFKKCRCEDMFLTALDTEEYAMTVCSFNDETPICERVSAFDIMRGDE